jgi:WD40 repeat protein
MWDLRTRRIVARLERGGEPSYQAATFSPNGNFVLRGGPDDVAELWEIATGKVKVVFQGHADRLNFTRFSPDGSMVLTGSSDGTARIWNADTGKSLVDWQGHAGEIRGAAWSGDMKFVVTTSSDRTATVWNAATARAVAELTGHTGPVNDAAISPNGKFVATVSDDGTARVYSWEEFAPIDDVLSIAPKRVTRSLSKEDRTTYLHDLRPPKASTK